MLEFFSIQNIVRILCFFFKHTYLNGQKIPRSYTEVVHVLFIPLQIKRVHYTFCYYPQIISWIITILPNWIVSEMFIYFFKTKQFTCGEYKIILLKKIQYIVSLNKKHWIAESYTNIASLSSFTIPTTTIPFCL